VELILRPKLAADPVGEAKGSFVLYLCCCEGNPSVEESLAWGDFAASLIDEFILASKRFVFGD
jgi:hypothetical protein